MLKLVIMEKVNQGLRKVFTLASALFVFGAYGENGVTVQMGADRDASLSCTVLDARYAEPSQCDIATSLLLDSDIKGDAEEPQWYFSEDRSTKQHQGLEALLLTQGWSRYDMPKSLSSGFQEPESPIEKSAEMSGTIKSHWRGKVLENAVFNVIAPQVNFGAMAVTDKKGRFSLPYPDYPDGTRYLLQSLNTKGNPEDNYVMDEQVFPVIPVISRYFPSANKSMAGTDIDYNWRIRHSEGMMNVMLGGVTVYGYSSDSPSDFYAAFANYSYTPGDFQRRGVTSLENAVQSIPGIIVVNGNVFARSRIVTIWIDGKQYDPEGSMDFVYMHEKTSGRTVNSLMGPVYSRPIMSDQMEYGQSLLTKLAGSYTLDDFKKIEFFDSNNSLIFQGPFRSPGGVLMFTTKDGLKSRGELPWHFQIYTPLGYQPKREFYTPKYELMDEEELNARPTLYWIPRAEFGADGRLSLPIPPSVSEAYVVVEGLKPDGTPVSYSEKVKR